MGNGVLSAKDWMQKCWENCENENTLWDQTEKNEMHTHHVTTQWLSTFIFLFLRTISTRHRRTQNAQQKNLQNSFVTFSVYLSFSFSYSFFFFQSLVWHMCVCHSMRCFWCIWMDLNFSLFNLELLVDFCCVFVIWTVKR